MLNTSLSQAGCILCIIMAICGELFELGQPLWTELALCRFTREAAAVSFLTRPAFQPSLQTFAICPA